MDALSDLVDDVGRYYTAADVPLQQGDIVLAPIGRFQTNFSVSSRWETFDQVLSELIRVEDDLPELYACMGYGWAMVVTHDCHIDREFNERVNQLRKGQRLKLRDAEELAEADPELDRFINVCPLIPPGGYRAEWTALARGEVIGTFPVPASAEHGIDDLVVDLTYRVTIDRHAIVARATAISEESRTWLRFNLARTDVFRTPQIGFELEQAVGKRIKAVTPHSANPLIVGIELSDGSRLELVHQPAEVRQDGSVRKKTPAS